MAEINAAYESLRLGTMGRAARAREGPEAGASDPEQAGRRRGGPPRPRPQRPVTGRVDTSQTFRPRNQTTTGGTPFRRTVAGAPPRASVGGRDPLRASDPTGPLERGRLRHFRPAPRPRLSEARERVLEFGKFRGHTLGEVADFEPSYVDWIAATISKDPELLAAARVIREDLDERGVVRRPRSAPIQRTPADRSA